MGGEIVVIGLVVEVVTATGFVVEVDKVTALVVEVVSDYLMKLK